MVRIRKAERRKYTTVTIPTPLFDRIKESIKDTGFSSVSDYVTFILRETTAKLSEAKKGSKGDKDAVIKKLEALGYI